MAAILLASSLYNFSARALSDAELDKFAQNDIYFYDPGTRSIYGGAICGDLNNISAIGNINGNGIYIMQVLAEEGYSATSIAGIIGNLMGEVSTFNAVDVEDGRGSDIVDSSWRITKDWECYNRCGFGIAQWTSGGRQLALQEFADKLGQSVLDLGVQARFLAKELKDRGRTPEVLNAKSLDEVTFDIYRYYETPGSSIWYRTDGKHPDYDNDYSPKSLYGEDPLDPNRTRKAYAEYTKRLGYAKTALEVAESQNLAPGVPATPTVCPNNGGGSSSGDGGGIATVSPENVVMRELIGKDSDHVACAPGTHVLVESYSQAHYRGAKDPIKIKLCVVENIKVLGLNEAHYGKNIVNGTDINKIGYAVVSSIMSGAYVAFANELKEKYGWELWSTLSFRTYDYQYWLYYDYYAGTGQAAAPGGSNHESGYAIDLNIHEINSRTILGDYTCEGSKKFPNVTDRSYPDKYDKNRWFGEQSRILCETSAKYGLYRNVSSEPWHIDAG